MGTYKDYLNYTIDPQLKLVCTEWHRVLSGEEYRAGLLHTQKLIKKAHLQYWLVYATVFNPPIVLDQKWTVEHLFPLLLKTDLVKIAFVLPGDHFLHMLAHEMIEKVHQKYGHLIQLECFSRVEHARHWLLTHEEAGGAITAYY